MFVVTFYSYKGGVGRTLALVNCAFRLAKQGRKVFILDFDLEAPGVDSFRALGGDGRPHKGIVEYVDRFKSKGEVEDIDDYVSKANPASTQPGEIRFMSAGRKDEEYKVLLSRLDWKHFYEQQSGYLFIENVKAAIEDKFAPDYVLIDSRTGLTDVSGICTLQLPDLVVLFFNLNNQNVLGVSQIYRSVRHNKLMKDIETLLVASPIPDVPDHFMVRRERISYAQKTIGADSINLILPFDPFMAFEETVLPSGEQGTYLAKSYDRLSELIRRKNKADVLTTLEDANELRDNGDIDQADLKYRDILQEHPDNAAALLEYSRFLRLRRSKSAIKYLERAQALAPETPGLQTQLIKTYLGSGEVDKATNLLGEFVAASEGADEIEAVGRVFEMKGMVEPAKQLYEKAIELSKNPNQAPHLDLGNVYMALNQVELAIEQYEKEVHTNPSSLAANYNLAYALHLRRNPRAMEFFQRAATLFENEGQVRPSERANAFQAMSHAYRALGKRKKAQEMVEAAIKAAAEGKQSRIFSSIQYKYIPTKEFLEETRRLAGKVARKQHARSR